MKISVSPTVLHGISHDMTSEMRDINAKNKEKIEECLRQYKQSTSLPRKKKKAVRRALNKEYMFWVSINIWYQEITKPFL
jgi:hypothetical protein